jgi:hypothetical protein
MSPDENTSGQLSSEAFTDFKRIYSGEFPADKISDDELYTRALGVLRLFDALLSPPVEEPIKVKVTNDEARVLAYLHKSICHEKRYPSVRDIAKVAGFSSSRSGMRLVDRFVDRNWMSRDENGKLKLAEWLADCKAQIIDYEP